ncbi:hypothetical protein PCASD_13365 [Puccinia coronata f. sp. avenae]|uniref:Uncharacterized protein n=1 Tax=Puccinia coronata f. sp. avenae TaxID=200324 RepID=A0A2N5TZA7_9BASI|nr:hypothetical protein PCASD_13365 [Puccinia coronata f. sp. avenae]
MLLAAVDRDPHRDGMSIWTQLLPSFCVEEPRRVSVSQREAGAMRQMLCHSTRSMDGNCVAWSPPGPEPCTLALQDTRGQHLLPSPSSSMAPTPAIPGLNRLIQLTISSSEHRKD